MASITVEKIKGYNAACKNGFAFDIGHFQMHGEKQLCKIIELPDGNKLRAEIDFSDDYDRKANAYGQTFNVPNGKHVPTLWINKWYKPERDGGMWHANGMGVHIPVGDAIPRRTFTALIKATENVTEEYIMEKWNSATHTDRIF